MAGYSYTKMGRRVGFDNTQNVTMVVGVVFILTALFFYTILHYVLHV